VSYQDVIDTLDGIDKLQEFVEKLLARSFRLQYRIESGKKRLSKFPLLSRLIKFHRFSRIRKIISSREKERSFTVVLMLSMNKKLSRLKKKYAPYRNS
jgi:hypothetical protein